MSGDLRSKVWAGPETRPQHGIYDENGSNHRENITDWALEQFRTHYGAATRRASSRKADESGSGSKTRRADIPKTRRADASTLTEDAEITEWDIFYYVYGLLHHPGYRTKFADNLKRELPRIPFAPDFWVFAKAGQELAKWHLEYESLEPWPLKWIVSGEESSSPLPLREGQGRVEASRGEKQPSPSPSLRGRGGRGVPLSYHVTKMKLTKDKTALIVNESLTLAGIPPEVFEYRLGNRSALEWVIDQYRVTKDERSGIESDPNRADDPEYIVRLVGQVVRVSVETVRIVKALPEQFSDAVPAG